MLFYSIQNNCHSPSDVSATTKELFGCCVFFSFFFVLIYVHFFCGVCIANKNLWCPETKFSLLGTQQQLHFYRSAEHSCYVERKFTKSLPNFEETCTRKWCIKKDEICQKIVQTGYVVRPLIST